ncbi:MAG: hypothetical protein M0T82_06585 [Desulfobacteraceae bacterium]|nr:hypothetical protein [Desulfobacteraceae bacterium]
MVKKKNLASLTTQTQKMGHHNGKEILAKTVIDSLPLSNTFSIKNFTSICNQQYLRSQVELIADGTMEKQLSPTTEQQLGTDTFVFFFLAPFSYPNTQCGILFKKEMQKTYKNKSEASPFDSGGLLEKFTLPPGIAPKDFLYRHLLPVPEHEELLEAALIFLFNDPTDYIHGINPLHPSPVNITGGDRRRWTHEVRIASPIPIYDPTGIEAVFLMKNRLTEPGIEDFLTYCNNHGILSITFDSPLNQAFDEMKQLCIAHIEGKIGNLTP